MFVTLNKSETIWCISVSHFFVSFHSLWFQRSLLAGCQRKMKCPCHCSCLFNFVSQLMKIKPWQARKPEVPGKKGSQKQYESHVKQKLSEIAQACQYLLNLSVHFEIAFVPVQVAVILIARTWNGWRPANALWTSWTWSVLHFATHHTWRIWRPQLWCPTSI